MRYLTANPYKMYEWAEKVNGVPKVKEDEKPGYHQVHLSVINAVNRLADILGFCDCLPYWSHTWIIMSIFSFYIYSFLYQVFNIKHFIDTVVKIDDKCDVLLKKKREADQKNDVLAAGKKKENKLEKQD